MAGVIVGIKMPSAAKCSQCLRYTRVNGITKSNVLLDIPIYVSKYHITLKASLCLYV